MWRTNREARVLDIDISPERGCNCRRKALCQVCVHIGICATCNAVKVPLDRQWLRIWAQR